MKKINKNKGVALITAMLITAITGSLAAGLTWNNSLDIRRTMTLMLHEQGIQVALGAETWVRACGCGHRRSVEHLHKGDIRQTH